MMPLANINSTPRCRPFLIKLKRITKILFPRLSSLPCLLLVWIIIISVAEQFFIYYVGLIPSKFYDILGNKNFQYFHRELMFCVLYALGIALVKGIRWFVQQQLYISCRRLLCYRLEQLYFQHNNYYHLYETGAEMQLIKEDIDALCSQYSELVSGVCLLPFVIGVYIYLVSLNLGWFGPLSAMLFVILSKLLSKAVTPVVVKYAVQHEEREEDYRQFHQRIREHAESIAFHNAGPMEFLNGSHRLNRVLAVQEKLYIRQLLLNLVINSFDYLGSIMSYVILFIPVYFSWYDYMDPVQICVLISQNAFLFIYLISVMNCFLLLWEKMGCFAVHCYNVDGLLVRLEMMSNVDTPLPGCKKDSPGWVLDHVTIISPESKHIIVQDLSLEISLGNNLLIIGEKSSGKTSLLRILYGLWKPSSGFIECSMDSSDLFFLPQVPVFTSGSLKDQITYPQGANRVPEDEALCIELLHLVDLENLLLLCGGLEICVPWEWGAYLSRREQQALCFIRALYHQPKILVADEATDSLMISVEEALMQCCLKQGITLIMTTSNSERLARYHSRTLRLGINGNWTLQENC